MKHPEMVCTVEQRRKVERESGLIGPMKGERTTFFDEQINTKSHSACMIGSEPPSPTSFFTSTMRTIASCLVEWHIIVVVPLGNIDLASTYTSEESIFPKTPTWCILARRSCSSSCRRREISMNFRDCSSSSSENSMASYEWDISRMNVANAELYICIGGPAKSSGLLL